MINGIKFKGKAKTGYENSGTYRDVNNLLRHPSNYHSVLLSLQSIQKVEAIESLETSLYLVSTEQITGLEFYNIKVTALECK